MPSACGPCRFGQYSSLQKILLERCGFADAVILSPCDANAYAGLSNDMRIRLFTAVLCDDVLQRLLTGIRPYETVPGTTEMLIDKLMTRLIEVMERKGDPLPVLREAVPAFKAIEQDRSQSRPRIGIVGEIYVRSSDFLNDDLERQIEAYGGEAIKSSLTEWMFYTFEAMFARQWKSLWERFNIPVQRWIYHKLSQLEHEYFQIVTEVLPERVEPDIRKILEFGSEYVPIEFEGESILTIGRALHFIRVEKVAAIVNAAPAFCMPGTITASILRSIELRYKVPVFSLPYDRSGDPNRILFSFLQSCTTADHHPAAGALSPAHVTAEVPSTYSTNS